MISTFTMDTAAETQFERKTKETSPYAEQSNYRENKETRSTAVLLLLISNNRRDSPLYQYHSAPLGADEHERELVTERENENQSMQVKVIIRIFKLFYSQVIRNKITSSPIVNSDFVQVIGPKRLFPLADLRKSPQPP